MTVDIDALVNIITREKIIDFVKQFDADVKVRENSTEIIIRDHDCRATIDRSATFNSLSTYIYVYRDDSDKICVSVIVRKHVASLLDTYKLIKRTLPALVKLLE